MKGIFIRKQRQLKSFDIEDYSCLIFIRFYWICFLKVILLCLVFLYFHTFCGQDKIIVLQGRLW